MNTKMLRYFDSNNRNDEQERFMRCNFQFKTYIPDIRIIQDS